MRRIKKVVVQYEDGQTDEFVGKGYIRKTTTEKVVEDPVIPDKTSTVPVVYYTIGLSVNAT